VSELELGFRINTGNSCRAPEPHDGRLEPQPSGPGRLSPLDGRNKLRKTSPLVGRGNDNTQRDNCGKVYRSYTRGFTPREKIGLDLAPPRMLLHSDAARFASHARAHPFGT